MKNDSKRKILALTSRTYPHGTRELFHLLPKDLNEDDSVTYLLK
jgi:hypothetical protein